MIELTDALDGAIARARGVTSELGATLDPLTDSMSRLIVYWTLAAAGGALAVFVFKRAYDLAAVVAVDGPGGVDHREAELDGETGAGSDLTLPPIGDLEDQTGGNRRPFPRGDHQGLQERRALVQQDAQVLYTVYCHDGTIL